MTLFVAGRLEEDNVLLALLGWLKAALAEREQPLQLLTLEFCAISPKLEHKPTALLYSAQGFRELGETRFLFQCGFAGGASEDAMAALMQHPNVKMPSAVEQMTKEQAFNRYLEAWTISRPAGSVKPEETSDRWLTAARNSWRAFSNRWFKTTLEL